MAEGDACPEAAPVFLRFRTILKEAADQFALIQLLVARPDLIPVVSQAEDSEIVSMLMEQKQLEGMYRDLLEDRSELERSNKDRLEGMHNELRELEAVIKESAASLYDSLKSRSTDLSKIQRHGQEMEQLFRHTVEDLSEARFVTFSNAVEDLREKQGQLQQLQVEQTDLEEKVNALKELWNSREDEFDAKCAEKQSKLESLIEELRFQRVNVTENTEYEKNTAKSHFNTIQRLRQQRLEKIVDEIDKLRAVIKRDEMVSAQTSDYLTEHRNYVTSMVEYWQKKSEQDISLAREELERLKRHRDSDFHTLTALQSRWESEAKEKLSAEEHGRLAKKRVKVEGKLNRLKYIAACRIRLEWRLYRRRKLREAAKKRKRRRRKKKKKTKKPGNR